MDSQLTAIANAVRGELINLDGVTKFSPNRRFATVYSEGSPADTIFFVESGLVKIYKRGDDNKEIILQIVGPGELFGEQTLMGEQNARHRGGGAAGRPDLRHSARFIAARLRKRPELWREIAAFLALRQAPVREENRAAVSARCGISHLVLHGGASRLIWRQGNGADYSIPLSQGELASLIGATRETTSTTLNALARRGVIKLGRRQLIVPSIEGVLAAANHRTQAAKVS